MTDPLNVNLDISDTETEIPLLPAGSYPMQIVASTIEANKDNSGLNWHIKLATTQAYTAVDGRPIAVNFPINMYPPLQAKADAADPENYKRNIAAAVDAIFGSSKNNRPTVDKALLERAQGQTVIADIVLETPTQGPYAGKTSNKVARLKKIG